MRRGELWRERPLGGVSGGFCRSISSRGRSGCRGRVWSVEEL